MAGLARFLSDGLKNVLTGLGMAADSQSTYAFCPLTPEAIEAFYRGSGIGRKAIDIPAFDAVREWRDWQAEADQIELLEVEESRLDIRAKVRQAEILRGLGGAALVLGAPGEPAMPINERGVGKGQLAFVHVVSRWQLTLGEMVEDPADPNFGGPKHFTLNTTGKPLRLHPSRVVCFKADPLPNIIGTGWEDQFWGESRVARLMSAVKNSDTAQSAFVSLVQKARYTRIGIPGLSEQAATTDGEARIMSRIAIMMKMESITNATVYEGGENGEKIDDFQVTWTGMPEMMAALDGRVAAVADIPMTRMFGRAAEGMNSSGDSQQRDWNKMVRARQELELRPCMDQLDVALIPSALGSRPEEIWWEWAPLDEPTQAEEATRFKTTMDAVEKVQNTGAIPDIAFAKALQNTLVENGWLPGLDGALAEVPEGERFPEPEPDETDPSALQGGGDPEAGGGTAPPAGRAANDAAPRTMYVRRDVQNVAEIKAWAKAQGIPDLADDLHVTIAFSRTPVDWIKMGAAWADFSGKGAGNLAITAGGPRVVEPLGEMTAVLMFASSDLTWRNREMREAGASWDYDDYQPHMSLTASPIDLAGIEPYRGKIMLGPEIFEEIRE